MKTKRLENVSSLQDVLLNPYYKGLIKKAKNLQAQADDLTRSACFARGKLAYSISQKLLDLVPKGPERMLLELEGSSFATRRSDPAYFIALYPKMTGRGITLLCELVNSSMDRSRNLEYRKIFWGNGCVMLTEYGINHTLKIADPETFMQNAISIINEAWAKNNLGYLSFDKLVDDEKNGQRFRILFMPGKWETKANT
ncbi:MAG: hypothetical protein WC603_00175 [Candidatus Paceibacterota bacterium]|jgi:hypothetical protein